MKIKNGFTMVEVLVVIGVIAILTVIIFPAINSIRAKNRDAERIADIAALQLGLSLYYNQHSALGYPTSIKDNTDFIPKYVPEESTIPPTSGDSEYKYVPLKKKDSGNKCTFYHLGITLELPSAQIDSGSIFNSTPDAIDAIDYEYCGTYDGEGFDGGEERMYQVHP